MDQMPESFQVTVPSLDVRCEQRSAVFASEFQTASRNDVVETICRVCEALVFNDEPTSGVASWVA
ncbi:hypothetical protein [Xanthomonas arboricola]|uniref:hypothetical protein n=1 Tax=Xanthomonas arboricola TaxID=56448 RepID=UPI00141AFD52|nr:hypothetical protein [Xanthomonas arboricola]NIK44282.1 hypothetical protein [Xanthomonas arboricola]